MSYLYHHGIKGMKWGVRRYQNKDGTLTPAGRKRYAAEYDKYAKSAARDVAKQQTDIYVRAYNRSADWANNGGIDKFNAAQKKKYGESYAKREGYESDYYRVFNSRLEKELRTETLNRIRTNPNYQKAQSIANKYSMYDWHEAARVDRDDITNGFSERKKKK